MQIPYKIIRSSRKTVAIQIHPDGTVIIRAPLRMPAKDIHAFAEEKAPWIAKHLEDLQVNEDKQIGVFFVKESLLTSGDAEKFAFKVFDYLWSDVAKLDRGIFFNPYDTLEDLIAAYVTKGVDVFKPGIFK